MATAQLSDILQHLRRANYLRNGGLTDGQLLEQFLARHEAAAFEALVHRHGPMVFSVCRRVLRNHHDAEDAFQATFLVLASKAASVVPRHMVGNWLYGVAYNTALKTRAGALRRRAKEREAAAMPRPEAPDELWRHLEPLLDHELHHLPDKYRVPIVLCDLEGKTRKEAAYQLGWPEGTVASRLARARDMLARRLARHGLTLSGGAVGALVSQNSASACVSVPLVTSLVKVAPLLAAGQAAIPGPISVKVAALAEGVLKAMWMTKLKIAMATFLGLSLLGFAATFLPGPATAQAKKDVPGDPNGPKAGGADPQPKTPAPEAPPKNALDVPANGQPKRGYQGGLMVQHVLVDEVNAARHTISASLVGSAEQGPAGQAPAKLVDMPVARDAEIMVGNRSGKLDRVRAGMRVSVQLALVQDRLVVAAILDDVAQKAAYTDAMDKAHRAMIDQAAIQLAHAQAQVENAQARLEAGKVDLVKAAEAGDPKLQAKAAAILEEATASLIQARAEARVAEAQAQAAVAAYEEYRSKVKK